MRKCKECGQMVMDKRLIFYFILGMIGGLILFLTLK